MKMARRLTLEPMRTPHNANASCAIFLAAGAPCFRPLRRLLSP